MTVKENFEEFHNAASQAINLFIRLTLTIIISCLRNTASFVDILREMTYKQLQPARPWYDAAGIEELQSEVIVSDKQEPEPVNIKKEEEFQHYLKLAAEGV